MAHDGLSNLHPLLWGFPLLLSLFYLVCFAVYACYKDFAELKEGLETEEADEPETIGDGHDAEAAADRADTASPEDDAPASTAGDGAETGGHKQDEGEAQAAEPSKLDFAIDVILCNSTDDANALGESASAEAAPASVPPRPEAQDEALIF